jgi:beta-lactamase class A
MNKIKTFFLRYKIVVFILLSVSIGWYFHYYYYTYIKDRSNEIVQIRENSSENQFINPLILVADNRKIEFEEYKDLKNKINDYINKSRSNNVTDISFYFRDLNSGEWIGVNEDSLYSPSSMLKVAILIAYSKLADNDSKILLEKAYYKPTDFSGQVYKPNQLSTGYYTIKQLLIQMIVESDNDAMHSLNNLHTEEVLKIFKDLELPDLLSDKEDFMSPRYYSRLFRALYNGSYVSRFYSNEALQLLTFTKFYEGIVNGTGSTTVAHKFGELTDTTNGVVTKRELHDCGIVYYPNKPYFICVMTKGLDFSDMEKSIDDISKTTFDYIKNQK